MPHTLPAEWTAQAAVMLTYPHADTDWSTQLTETESVYLNLAKHICDHEQLIVACHNEQVRQHVAVQLARASIPAERYALHLAPCDDTWTRDHGPISIYQNQQRLLLDFQFNAWGNKYAAHQDNQITRRLHAAGAFADSPLRSVDFILEGGSIDCDGQGTLLSSKNCLLSPQRNGHLSQAEIERTLQEQLGVQRILWLENGYLSGDDTDSHIDTLARFCDPQTIAYVACEDPKDPHYAPLQVMREELHSLRQSHGEPYTLVPLPLPAPKYNADQQRLPATYANFLIINGAVLVPTYADAQDQIALNILAHCFPKRKIIGIDCQPLIQQFGSLHCISMQIPIEHPHAERGNER